VVVAVEVDVDPPVPTVVDVVVVEPPGEAVDVVDPDAWVVLVVVVDPDTWVVVVVVDPGTDVDVVDAGGTVDGGAVVVEVSAGTIPGSGVVPGRVATVVPEPAGGLKYITVPSPRKATAMSTVERRTGTRRETGTDMKPTKALCGVKSPRSSSCRGSTAVGSGPPTAVSSRVPSSSPVTASTSGRARRLRATRYRRPGARWTPEDESPGPLRTAVRGACGR